MEVSGGPRRHRAGPAHRLRGPARRRFAGHGLRRHLGDAAGDHRLRASGRLGDHPRGQDRHRPHVRDRALALRQRPLASRASCSPCRAPSAPSWAPSCHQLHRGRCGSAVGLASSWPSSASSSWCGPCSAARRPSSSTSRALALLGPLGADRRLHRFGRRRRLGTGHHLHAHGHQPHGPQPGHRHGQHVGVHRGHRGHAGLPGGPRRRGHRLGSHARSCCWAGSSRHPSPPGW